MIRIGILGAAAIAPNALILPAASIVGIEIAAVAASSAEKANAFLQTSTRYRRPCRATHS